MPFVPDELHPLLAVFLCLDEPVDQSVLSCILGSTVQLWIDTALSKGILSSQIARLEGEDPNVVYALNSENLPNTASDDAFAKESRDSLHQKIGRRLIRSGVHSELAIKQLLMAEESFFASASDDTKCTTADTCLQVGTAACRKVDYEQAIKVLDFGIELLTQCLHPWKRHYALALSLYQAAAEAEQWASDYDKAMKAIKEVQMNARSFRDTLVVTASEIAILTASNKTKDAAMLGLEVLEKLNHPLPRRRSKAFVLFRLFKVKRMLDRKTEQMILRMPDMVDEDIGHAMKILSLLFSAVYVDDPWLLTLTVAEMIALTIKHGLCNLSAPAFAFYGTLLGRFGDMERALKYAKLALALYERFPVKEWLPRTYLAVYGGVYSCRKAMESVDPLLQSYHVGLETGDTEFAFIAVSLYMHMLVVTGKPFYAIREEGNQFLAEARKRNQGALLTVIPMLTVPMQFFENISGEIVDPLCLTGTYFDEHDKSGGASSLDPAMFSVLYMFKMILAFLQGNFRLAVEHSRAVDIGDFRSAHVIVVNGIFYRSLSLMALCRATGCSRRKTIREVNRLRKLLWKRAITIPDICTPKLYLIDGELAWIKEGNDAFFHFRSALNCAVSEGKLFDEGLAHESLGMYLLTRNSEFDDAMKHLIAAKDAYQRSGAVIKVHQLQRFIEAKKTPIHS